MGTSPTRLVHPSLGGLLPRAAVQSQLEMDSLSLDEDPRFLEKVLREFLGDPLLVVEKVKCELATSAGSNFMSIVKRAEVSGQCSDEQQPLRVRGVLHLNLAVRGCPESPCPGGVSGDRPFVCGTPRTLSSGGPSGLGSCI